MYIFAKEKGNKQIAELTHIGEYITINCFMLYACIFNALWFCIQFLILLEPNEGTHLPDFKLLNTDVCIRADCLDVRLLAENR